MATAAELLNTTNSTDTPFVISEDLRTITIPSGQEILGVYSDDSVRRIYFEMPRYCDGTDLSTFQVTINFQNSNGNSDRYYVSDKVIATDLITFSWLVGRTACETNGTTAFNVCLRLFSTTDASVVLKEFNTTTAEMTVLPGLEADAQGVQKYTDAVQSLITGWANEVAGAEYVDAELNGLTFTVTNRNNVTKTVTVGDTISTSDLIEYLEE